MKQGFPSACARARGQHCTESVGRGHLVHVVQRHGRARRQISVRGSGGAARRSEPRGRHPEQKAPRGHGVHGVLIKIRQESGPVRAAPLEPRTPGRYQEGRDPLRRQNQRPQGGARLHSRHDPGWKRQKPPETEPLKLPHLRLCGAWKVLTRFGRSNQLCSGSGCPVLLLSAGGGVTQSAQLAAILLIPLHQADRSTAQGSTTLTSHTQTPF